MTPHKPILPSCICGDPLCSIPYGLCHCGCGGQVHLVPSTERKRGYIEGQPFRFLIGHNMRTKKDSGLLGKAQDRYRMRLRAKGLCQGCGQVPSVEGRLQCESCAEKTRNRTKEWRSTHVRVRTKNENFCRVCQVPIPSRFRLCDEHRKRICEQCGQQFVATAGRAIANLDLAKFCSKKCRYQSMKGIYPKGLRYCRKGMLGRVGSEHPRWGGGTTRPSLSIRNQKEVRLWREAVYKRDKWTCVDCGQRGGILHAHHIKSFAKYPDLRTDIDNGVTLCVDCHSKRHGRKIPDARFYGRVNRGQMKMKYGD